MSFLGLGKPQPPLKTKECPTCLGKKYVTCYECDGKGCQECKETGKIQCYTCHGFGWIKAD